MNDSIIIEYITDQLKQKKFTLQQIYQIYYFLTIFPNLVNINIIKNILNLLEKNYPTSNLNKKVKRLYLKQLQQKGSGIFSILGNTAKFLGNTALSSVKLVGNTALGHIENQATSILDKAKFVTNHINCNNPALLECLSVSVPESAPLLAACAGTGAETLGAGCIPALTELGGAAVICMTKNCKPKL